MDSDRLQEISKIDDQVKPKYKVLVLDSMTGQESLNVAKAFDQAVPFNSVILTKMDSEARGGAAFAFNVCRDYLAQPREKAADRIRIAVFVRLGKKTRDSFYFHGNYWGIAGIYNYRWELFKNYPWLVYLFFKF